MAELTHQLLLLLCGSLALGAATSTKPHIIIMMADDLGWNDVSFHGSDQFLTANIDALAFSGVILQDYYTQPICTPSRAALLTGRHPINTGMEHDVIYAPQPWGLPLSERLMPQYLAALGYIPRAVGKWHLGFCKADYTPTCRGFLSHYGTWLGHQDHFTYMGFERNPGYDLHRGLNASWENKGRYSTDVFTEEAETIISGHDVNQSLFLYLAYTAPHAPLQAHPNDVSKFSYIKKKKRRTFAAMVTKMDESVGRVVQALRDKDMLNNSIILFLSDNGGATNGYNGNVASNWPLRGCKDTLWEGGVRGVGLIWSPLLKSSARVHRGLINVQDWLPTLLSATNQSNPFTDVELDGVSQWSSLNQESAAPYQTMLHNIDPIAKVGALRKGPWKLVYGRKYGGHYDGFYGKLPEKIPYDMEAVRESPAGRAVQTTASPLPKPEVWLALRTQATVSCGQFSTSKGSFVKKPRNSIMNYFLANAEKEMLIVPPKMEDWVLAKPHEFDCEPHLSPCLFNLDIDPCETQNVALMYPNIVNDLMAQMKAYNLTTPNNRREDDRSYPVHWNYTWTHWLDFL